MKRNQKQLYEKIMREVSREVKQILENNDDNVSDPYNLKKSKNNFFDPFPKNMPTLQGNDYEKVFSGYRDQTDDSYNLTIDGNDDDYNLFNDDDYLNEFARKIWNMDYELFDEFDDVLLDACTENPDGIQALMYNVVTRCPIDLDSLVIDEINLRKKLPDIIQNTSKEQLNDYIDFIVEEFSLDLPMDQFTIYDHIMDMGDSDDDLIDLKNSLIISFINSKVSQIIVKMFLRFIGLCIETDCFELINDKFLDVKHILNESGLSPYLFNRFFLTSNAFKMAGNALVGLIFDRKHKNQQVKEGIARNLSLCPIMISISIIEDIRAILGLKD